MRSGMSLRIAVVGGGIGGLAVAGFLHKAGLDVTVYEQAARITEVGAGLVVTPNAVRLHAWIYGHDAEDSLQRGGTIRPAG
jgi:2-polyprenyl-6-methoxyphenol hydroxylase-like FAD-dependent oxidoreductase